MNNSRDREIQNPDISGQYSISFETSASLKSLCSFVQGAPIDTDAIEAYARSVPYFEIGSLSEDRLKGVLLEAHIHSCIQRWLEVIPSTEELSINPHPIQSGYTTGLSLGDYIFSNSWFGNIIARQRLTIAPSQDINDYRRVAEYDELLLIEGQDENQMLVICEVKKGQGPRSDSKPGNAIIPAKIENKITPLQTVFPQAKIAFVLIIDTRSQITPESKLGKFVANGGIVIQLDMNHLFYTLGDLEKRLSEEQIEIKKERQNDPDLPRRRGIYFF